MTMKESDSPIAYRAILPHRDTNRQPEQDIAKGIGMVFVLFLHTVTLFTVGGRDTVPSGLASIIFLALTGYMMPFFFIMSGYNCLSKTKDSTIRASSSRQANAAQPQPERSSAPVGVPWSGCIPQHNGLFTFSPIL